MGIKSFLHEYKSKASASRMFKALITKGHEEVPKFSGSIQSLEVVGGGGLRAGSVWKAHFPGAHVKQRVDEVDETNYVCKFTLIEGAVLGDKLEKVVYNLKFEPSSDGGCLVKLKIDYHTKPGVELNDNEEPKADKEQSLGLYKACDEYLCANPNVCA